MPKFMDYMISPLPLRVFDPKADKSRLRVKSLTIVSAGHLPGRIQQRLHAEFEHWAFVYITKGKGFYQVDGGPRQLVEEGSLFCLYPGAAFHYGPEQGGYWDEYYFTVEGQRISEWLEAWPIVPGAVKRVGLEDSFAGRMEMVFMLIDNGGPVNLDRAALLLESFLYELVVKSDDPEMNPRKMAVIRVIGDLMLEIRGITDPAEIAARHHISLSTMRRMVHDYTGFPLNEFIHRTKAAEAKNILLNTDAAVKEIAEMLGYKDVFYFSRLFKKYVGIAPKTFRVHMGV